MLALDKALNKALNKAARLLPADVLRLIYLEYCKAYYTDPMNQLHMACEYFGPTGHLCVSRAKLQVRKRFRDPRCDIYLGERRIMSICQPMGQVTLDLLVDSLIGGKWRARHHRMDIVAVWAKSICGDYSYTRPKRDLRDTIDVSGPRAFVYRAVINWLERSEVPISASTLFQDIVRGRAAKLGDRLPDEYHFR